MGHYPQEDGRGSLLYQAVLLGLDGKIEYTIHKDEATASLLGDNDGMDSDMLQGWLSFIRMRNSRNVQHLEMKYRRIVAGAENEDTIIIGYVHIVQNNELRNTNLLLVE